MSKGQGGTDLFQDFAGDLGVEFALSFHNFAQAAASQEAHDQVSAVRFPPIIIERDNMRMLEARYYLCLALKTTNEFGRIGVLGQDDFDRHFAEDGLLTGAVDDTKSTLPQQIVEVIGFNRLAR